MSQRSRFAPTRSILQAHGLPSHPPAGVNLPPAVADP